MRTMVALHSLIIHVYQSEIYWYSLQKIPENWKKPTISPEKVWNKRKGDR